MLEFILGSAVAALAAEVYLRFRRDTKDEKIFIDDLEFSKCLSKVIDAASFTLIDCKDFANNFIILENLKYNVPANANIYQDLLVTPMQDIDSDDLA